MRLSDFDYTLPEELIAQEPLPERDHSRLLVLDRRTGAYWDRFFYQFPEEVAPGSVLVLNNTRVFPARLFGRRRGFTGRIELLLLRRQEGTRWEALVKPGRIARPGTEVIFDEGRLRARIIMSHGAGKYLVEFLPTSDVRTPPRSRATCSVIKPSTPSIADRSPLRRPASISPSASSPRFESAAFTSSS
jgi:S-adenosylmethionine:tRNA ribosyltransferase-isomerase